MIMVYSFYLSEEIFTVTNTEILKIETQPHQRNRLVYRLCVAVLVNLRTYPARTRNDVPLQVILDILPVDLPQQPLDLLLYLPLPVYAHGYHAGAEEHDGQHAGRYDAVEVGVGLGAQLVVETATGLVVGLVTARPQDLGVQVQVVVLEGLKIVRSFPQWKQLTVSKVLP